jgi:hypothetical protein
MTKESESIIKGAKEALEYVKINFQMRVDQMKALDIYAESAKQDKDLYKFLKTMKVRLEEILADETS